MMSLQRRRLLAAAALLVASAVQPAWAASPGQRAPDFSLQDTAGHTVRLSDFQGKIVVLEWTNPGCPFVRKHYDSGNMGATQQLARELGVVWLSINSTAQSSPDHMDPPELAAWLKERQGAASAVLMDEEGTVGQTYGAKTTPHMFIVDGQGTLVYAGAIDSIPSARQTDIAKAINHVKTALGELTNGQPVSQPATRAYGCSIKYKI